MGLWQKKDKRQDVSLFNNYSDLPVSTEGCDTLVVVIAHGFLAENKQEKKNKGNNYKNPFIRDSNYIIGNFFHNYMFIIQVSH